MKRIALVLLLAGCAVKQEAKTTLGPRVVLLDESLLGQTQEALEERFGKPCYTADDGVGWNLLQNTVMTCAVPTGQVLAVYMKGGRSAGYFLGEWY